MDRLLRRNGDCIERVCHYGHEDMCYGCVDRTKCNADIFDRLAHYEDLEAQGRLVELPCKAGDELFRIVKPSGVCKPFVPVLTDKVEPFGIYYKNIMGAYSYIPFDEIGKTVFLTRPEAEAALAASGKEG